jgi:Arc-like DNA binding domain
LGGERTVPRKPTDTAHLNLRYPEGLRRRLERAGKSKGRSLNSEIVHRLEQSFRREDFEPLQDVITEGMLKVIGAVSDVVRRMPPSAPGGLFDLLTPEQRARVFERPVFTDKEDLPEAQSTGRKEVLEMSDDELAKRIAEAEAAEQRAADKRDDSK